MQDRQDVFQHRLCVVDYFVIPVSQYSETTAFQKPGSLPVVFGHRVFGVLTAIKLYDCASFDTDEIENVVFDPVLSPEFEAAQLAVTNVPP